MPDPDQGDHWDFLAADLGATPVPEQAASREDAEPPANEEMELDFPEESNPEEAEGTDSAVEPEMTEDQPEKPKKRSGRKGDRVVSGFGYRRGSVDWVNLARELGVEAMEEVPAPIPASEAASESVPSEEGRVEVVEVVETRIETTSHSVRREEPISADFGAGILEVADLESTSPSEEVGADQDDQDEEQGERKGRRRRRRRKPRKAEVSDEQPAESAVLEEVTPEDIVSEQTEDEETGDRPRRRGRKRAGRRREPREKVTAETKEFGADLEVEDAIGERFEDFEVVDAGSEEEVDEGDSAKKKQRQGERSKEKRSKKITHRGIPSWDEAIGYIIDSNMDNRSKKPEPNGFRQRSGRRRGGDRSGNRGRS